MRNVHRESTQAYGPRGDKAPLIDVQPGALIYDAKGNQAQDLHELKGTYPVYHCTDLNVAGLTPRTPPNASDRAITAQNAAFAEQCKANGQPVREPNEGERIGMVVADEQEKLKTQLREIAGVDIKENVGRIKEAQMVVKDGTPTIQIPKADVFEDINQQASSLVHAACHAHLYKEAVDRAGRATAAGHTDEAAEARVAAYQLPAAQRAKSDDFARADLAATYAAVNRTTAMPAEYTPPASTQSAETREKWAQTLEARGGMSAVSRDITNVERTFDSNRQELSKQLTRERAEEREKARAAEQGHGRQPQAQAQAGPADKPITPGGDPSVAAPPNRGGGPGTGKTQTQERGAPAEKEQPAR